jgi:hypothetical protein
VSVRTGFDIQETWSTLVTFFPTIWTADHRGDGLAQVLMEVQTVVQEDFGNVYPQQMPVHTAIIDGAWVYDPRDDDQDPDDHTTWLFSSNLALIRLDHLTKPYGGKLSLADMYLPDWIAAADVCDETVINVDEGEERAITAACGSATRTTRSRSAGRSMRRPSWCCTSAPTA